MRILLSIVLAIRNLLSYGLPSNREITMQSNPQKYRIRTALFEFSFVLGMLFATVIAAVPA